MDDYESLSHTKWECKYLVVFIPKCRRKTLYTELRRHLGELFRKLAEQKQSRIEEGHLLPDHVLGQRVLRINSRAGPRDDTRLHQETRRGGQAPRADESVALNGHLQVANKSRGRVSDPI
jgi:hypothetical protein